MKNNPFKNFSVFNLEVNNDNPANSAWHSIRDISQNVEGELWEDNEELARFAESDPTGQQWSALGFTKSHTETAGYFHDLDGKGYLFAIRFAERILPSKVRDEYIQKQVASIEEREGRKIGRKEYAELRYETECSLLPKAFIRPSVIHCIISKTNRLYVFTSSAKRSDSIITFLIQFFSTMNRPLVFTSVGPKLLRSVENVLTSLAISTHEAGDTFIPTSPMVLKKEDEYKSVVRIKDNDAQRDEYHSLIKKGFLVNEMGLTRWEGGDEILNFKLNTGFVFKGITLSDTIFSQDTEEGGFHAVAWLALTEYEKLLNDTIALFNGGQEDDGEL